MDGSWPSIRAFAFARRRIFIRSPFWFVCTNGRESVRPTSDLCSPLVPYGRRVCPAAFFPPPLVAFAFLRFSAHFRCSMSRYRKGDRHPRPRNILFLFESRHPSPLPTRTLFLYLYVQTLSFVSKIFCLLTSDKSMSNHFVENRDIWRYLSNLSRQEFAIFLVSPLDRNMKFLSSSLCFTSFDNWQKYLP